MDLAYVWWNFPGGGAIVVLVVVFVREALNCGDAVYGMIISATAVGSFVGTTMTWLKKKMSDLRLIRLNLLGLGLSSFFSTSEFSWMGSIDPIWNNRIGAIWGYCN